MKATYTLLGVLLGTALVYGTMVVLSAEFNVMQWHWSVRTLAVLWWCYGTRRILKRAVR